MPIQEQQTEAMKPGQRRVRRGGGTLTCTMAEAIRLLGVRRETVLRLIAGRHLPGSKQIGEGAMSPWLIPRRSIERFVAREFVGNQVPLPPLERGDTVRAQARIVVGQSGTADEGPPARSP